MTHIFFIDPLEKLNFKKDSTLMMALTFQSQGHQCYLLFEEDFYIRNDKNVNLDVFTFDGEFEADGCYLKSFAKKEKMSLELTQEMILHMRIDPPYDSRYQRYLWMLDFVENQSGAKVINSPLKIMKYNEKLIAYKNTTIGHKSYVGSSLRGFHHFIETMKEDGHSEIILKPLDLYSGIGVEKVEINHDKIDEIFSKKVLEFQGAIVCQPFIKDVYNGEYRSIYFNGKELGTIIKRPNKGEYLANIAQGAKFEKIELPSTLKETCDKIAKELFQDGVNLVAFDLLGGKVNEVNVTCPGLLVEVSYAYKKNLCLDIVNRF